MRHQTINLPYQVDDSHIESFLLSPGSLLPSNNKEGQILVQEFSPTPEKFKKAFSKAYLVNDQPPPTKTPIRKPLIDIFNSMVLPSTPKPTKKLIRSQNLQKFCHRSVVIEKIKELDIRGSIDLARSSNFIKSLKSFHPSKELITTASTNNAFHAFNQSVDFDRHSRVSKTSEISLSSQIGEKSSLFDFTRFISKIQDYDKSFFGYKKLYTRSKNPVYKGDIQNGLPNGNGKLYNSSTSSYIDLHVNYYDFQNSSYSWSHLTSNFINGKPSGFTTINFHGKQKFMGICVEGNIQGDGSFTDGKEFLIGVWENNKLIKKF